MTPTLSSEVLAFRHPIVLAHHLVKSLILIGCTCLIIWALRGGVEGVPTHLLSFVLAPIALILFNYGMIKIILSIIHFSQKFIIVDAQKVMIFENTLFLQEDSETINREKIVKIDTIQHGIMSLFFTYGHITLEQARNEVRTIHCVYRPYELVKYLQPRHTPTGSPSSKTSV